MEAIGGYLSLELPFGNEYHKNALRLNTGRNCLEYILRARAYKKVYIPYYTCDAVIEPFKKLAIPYEFYHISIGLELVDNILLKKGEALLYTNYFGLKQRYVETLSTRYGEQLIVDNTQAFYAKPIAGVDTFYTCRKFFGVPDGAYLYCDKNIDIEIEQDYSYNRAAHLLKRIDLSAEDGYMDFRLVEDGLESQPIRKMSKLTHRMMLGIDYESMAQKRRANYRMLQEALEKDNNLKLTMDSEAVPLVYPFLGYEKSLREKLIENKIFIARYWPNVMDWKTEDDLEYKLALQMVPLPIDQRYGENEMRRIIQTLKNI